MNTDTMETNLEKAQKAIASLRVTMEDHPERVDSVRRAMAQLRLTATGLASMYLHQVYYKPYGRQTTDDLDRLQNRLERLGDEGRICADELKALGNYLAKPQSFRPKQKWTGKNNSAQSRVIC